MLINRSIVWSLCFTLITANLALAQFAGGNGSIEDPYHVETAVQLDSVRYHLDACFVQTADIDLGNYDAGDGMGWLPIGSGQLRFTGTYDGQNYVIESMVINNTDLQYASLFGISQDATILNVGLSNVYLVGGNDVSALISYSSSTIIRGCFSSGLIESSGSAGGLIGSAHDNTIIENSYSTCEISASAYSGGLVGILNLSSIISRSYATGNVMLTGSYAGGLVGHTSNNSTVTNCFSTGNAAGLSSVGGVIGFHAGSVVSDSYSKGNVTGSSIVGGLVGENGNSSIVDRCFSTGAVVSETTVKGGLIGQNLASVQNSFWDIELSGQSESAGGTGLSSAEMKDLITFTDLTTHGLSNPWDFMGNIYDDEGFAEIWDIDLSGAINSGYPYLAWEDGASQSLCDTLAVPVEHASIQAAIDASSDWDIIIVQPGIYYENITINGKRIILGSRFLTTADTSYISTTIIDGDSLDHVVVLENLDEGALLSGFTIQNGYPHLNAWPANGGGGIYVENSIGSGPSITDCIISNNHTGDYGIGGGLFINSPASLRNCTITGNTSMDGGGGLAVGGGAYSFSFNNLKITNNYTQSFGGGLYSEWVNLELNNCIISDNIAYQQGGGIHYNSGGDLTLTNVVLHGNSVERDPGNGGALHASGSSININFSTIVNNASTSRDEIVTMNGALDVVNSIVWSASDSAFIGFYSHGEIASISNSVVQGGPNAVLHTVNNEINTEYILDSDPQFVNPVEGDYHLQPSSPCIGFGTVVSQPTTDILENPRPDPSGTNPDIGAYESPFAYPIQDPDQNLVAYYPFAGNANDESGNGNDGLVSGAILTTDRFGDENSAYWFDGLDDYIDLGDHFDTINHLTIALWVNFDSLCFGEHDCGIIQKWVAGDWSQKSFSLVKEGDGSAPTYSDEVISRYFSGGIDEFVEARTTALVEDQWYFLTTTFTDSMVEMYVDGILVDMVESTLVINDTDTPVYIGNNYSGSNPFHGKIDDIRIYSRALSPDEILALYNPSQVQVSLPSMTASVGDTVVVPLQVNLPVNQTFDSAELQFTGYQSGLQYFDIDLTGSMLEGLDWSIAENETDTLLFTAYAGSQEISGSGVLCNLRFVVTGDLCATVPIEISHAVFNTMVIENITNGSIHIQPVPVYGDVDGNGVIQAHDAALILKHTVGVDTLYCQEVVNADVDTNGVLSALDASNVLRYVVQLIDSLPVSGTSPDLLAQGSISLDDQEAVAGGTLDFPVYLNNGSNILSFQGELSFDASKLSPADNFITWSGEMDNFSVETDLQNGHLKFAAAGANPDGQNAVIAMLQFNVSDHFSLNESTTITINNIKLNENIEYSDISAQVMSVTSVNHKPGQPQEYSLSPNYPNPFNPSTTIKYGLPEGKQVRLMIYDIRGTEIVSLVNQHQSPGWYEAVWNGRDTAGNLVGTGIYLVRIQAGQYSQTRKMLLLK